jgi:hypothetical protein
MNFPYFRFPFLKWFLFLSVVCLLVELLLYYFVMELIKFLLGLVVNQLLFLFNLVVIF